MSEAGTHSLELSKHRLETLVDGIFAVAMTLLVIELKIPENVQIQTADQLHNALLHLIPKAISWLISFFVLAIYWVSHHRLFHFVRHVDGKLTWLTIIYLGCVSLIPFCSALSGEYGGALVSQVLYSLDMMALGTMALLKSRYVFNHPELCSTPMPVGTYRGARMRTSGLIIIGLTAIIISWAIPGKGAIGNSAFMLMIVFGKIGRRIEARKANQPSAIQSV